MSQKRKIQSEGFNLKAINEFGGMEGNGVSFKIYLGTKKVGVGQDDGVGAGIQFDWLDKAAGEKFVEVANALWPDYEYKNILDEEFAAQLLNEFHFVQDNYKSNMKSTFFCEAGDEPGSLRYIGAPYSARVAEHIRNKYKDLIFIANEEFDFYPKGYVKPRASK